MLLSSKSLLLVNNGMTCSYSRFLTHYSFKDWTINTFQDSLKRSSNLQRWGSHIDIALQCCQLRGSSQRSPGETSQSKKVMITTGPKTVLENQLKLQEFLQYISCELMSSIFLLQMIWPLSTEPSVTLKCKKKVGQPNMSSKHHSFWAVNKAIVIFMLAWKCIYLYM